MVAQWENEDKTEMAMILVPGSKIPKTMPDVPEFNIVIRVGLTARMLEDIPLRDVPIVTFVANSKHAAKELIKENIDGVIYGFGKAT